MARFREESVTPTLGRADDIGFTTFHGTALSLSAHFVDHEVGMIL